MAGILDSLSATTITNYKKGAIDSVVENNPFLSVLFNKAQVERKQSGDALEGVIEAGRFSPRFSAPGEDRSGYYTSKARHKRWRLDWSEISVEDSVDFGVLRRNNGPQALVSTAETEIPAIYRDILTNGSTSLNGAILSNNGDSNIFTTGGLPLMGLPTLLPGASAQQTVAQAITSYDLEGFNPDTGALTGAAPADTDLEVGIGGSATATNYAGLSLKYNALTGVDGLKADSWTPTLVNTSATAWSGTNDDEANAITKYTQYAIQRASRFSNQDQKFRPTFCVTTNDQLYKLGAKLTSIQNVYLKPGDDTTNKWGTGFKTDGMIFHAGLWFWFDQSVPTGRGYVINANMAKLFLQPAFDTIENESIPPQFNTTGSGVAMSDLIESHIHFDPSYLRLVVAALINGQTWFHPRYQAAWDAYS
jgi:hypothetical protein